MAAHPDPASGPVRRPVPRPRGARPVPLPAGTDRRRRSEPAGATGPVTALRVEIRPGRPQAVVAVTGDLGARGGPLLAALIGYVAGTAGSPVAVDLGGVSSVDAHGVAPVLHSRVVVVAASAPVGRLLTALGTPVVRGLPPAPDRRPSDRAGGGCRLAP